MRPPGHRSYLQSRFVRGPEPMGMPSFNPGRRPTRPLTPLPPVKLTDVDRFGLGSALALIVGSAVGFFLATRYLIALVVGP
jgi:hypothetical protein